MRNSLSVRQRDGFTIVELLIVVVVIAILAAITTVAYNGIQNRAKASAAQSIVSQAVKKIALYAVENNGNPPTSLSQAGVTNTDAIQYTSNGTTYCITGTNQNVSYFQSQAMTTATTGACPGHGANGVVAIENLVTNPSVETNISGWGQNWGTAGNGTATRLANGGWDNHGYFRMVWSATPTVQWGGLYASTVAVTEGETYTVSAWVRQSKAQPINIYMRPNNYPTQADLSQTGPTVPANTWTRVSITRAVPSGVGVTTLQIRVDRSGAGSWVAGDTFEVGAVMMTKGSTLYEYADGNSANWAWSGAQNNSSSMGMPL